MTTSCQSSHSVELYLASKPAEIIFPSRGLYSEAFPFVTLDQTLKVRCPTFEELGFCPQGYKCRFLSAHYTMPVESEKVGTLLEDEEKRGVLRSGVVGETGESNGLPSEIMKKLARKKVRSLIMRRLNRSVGDLGLTLVFARNHNSTTSPSPRLTLPLSRVWQSPRSFCPRRTS